MCMLCWLLFIVSQVKFLLRCPMKRPLVYLPSLCTQRPHKANGEEMTKYHSDDYIKFLRSIRPDNMSEYSKQMQRCEYMMIATLYN